MDAEWSSTEPNLRVDPERKFAALCDETTTATAASEKLRRLVGQTDFSKPSDIFGFPAGRDLCVRSYGKSFLLDGGSTACVDFGLDGVHDIGRFCIQA